MITHEKRFDVIFNEETKEITFLLSARPMPPTGSAKMGFNGKDCALLARDEHEDILLTDFPKPIISKLDKTTKVSILEITHKGTLVFTYTVDVFKDPELDATEI
ncbi:MAG: hypothetical protein JW812_03275 [Alphaproteobacteria bacterium]|nr:hypothetical protein [Alphaproteobacteria bacterium]MBN2779830.1 hypothetical protein [Alphaproteobacteria bacterium]